MPEATPLQTVRAAAEAGFAAVGLWIEPERWTAHTTAEVRAALADGGLTVLDAEVVWLRPGPMNPAHLRALDIAAELGAANVLVVSSDPDAGATAGKFAALCEHARGMPLRVALEFGAFTDVPDLHAALAILGRVDLPNQALLVDALHLHRSGGDADALAAVPRQWFSYAQLCDASAVGPAATDRAAIREEAVDRRSCPGEGGLPLRALLAALPSALPLSVEVRSSRLREDFPDFSERARVVRRLTQRWFDAVLAPV
ncbi:TIM barrel protein [Aromatoleum toluvorans]|uniref:TIM barrel protein n=2 Tax=Aromatoleum toluvorans TaxID=92002 RepID=A0ABX1PV36_9RHOO|nr:TIM barrel protein [Aromatoleum toluvorans]NMG42480.1 TIM barrel protein [Aromatoleum toluvorans]